MSASAKASRAANRGAIGLETDLAMLKSPSSEIECINSRCGGCCADLPWVKAIKSVSKLCPKPRSDLRKAMRFALRAKHYTGANGSSKTFCLPSRRLTAGLLLSNTLPLLPDCSRTRTGLGVRYCLRSSQAPVPSISLRLNRCGTHVVGAESTCDPMMGQHRRLGVSGGISESAIIYKIKQRGFSDCHHSKCRHRTHAARLGDDRGHAGHRVFL